MKFKSFIRHLKVAFFLEDPEKKEKDIDYSYPCCDVNPTEETKIFVDDETPDFLKKETVTEDVCSSSSEDDKPQDSVPQKISEMEETEIIDAATAESDTEMQQPQSLLDNKQLVKMFEECSGILKELDRIKPGFRSEDSQDLMEIVRERLIQAMCLSGGTLIDNDTVFDLLRHSCKNMPNAVGGEEIAEIIEPGIALDDRVIVKAQVELKK